MARARLDRVKGASVMSDLSLRPGLSLGPYPQRRDPRARRQRIGPESRGSRGRRFHPAAAVKEILQWDSVLQNYDDRALDAVVRELRARLVRRGLSEKLIRQAFAVVREVAARALGLRHGDDQLAAGWLIMQGKLVETAAGADRTFAISLPACTAAMAGVPVHVATADDSLAERGRERLRPLYQRLGLTSASVVTGMAPELRRDAYAADIAHTTARQLARDYLRDCVEMGGVPGKLRLQYRQIQQRLNGGSAGVLLLRGLCFAILDEADTLLVDQAQVPAVLENPGSGGEALMSPGDDSAVAPVFVPDSRSNIVAVAADVSPADSASLPYQKFFGRYLHLGGSAVTLTENAAELRQVYALEVVATAARRRARAAAPRVQICRDESDKQRDVLARIAQLEQAQRPVLVSTGSAAEAQQVGAWLRQKRIVHRIFGARTDQEESGAAGAVTIVVGAAAGISSIELDEALATRGGLQVISIGLPGSRRLERRLCEFAAARDGGMESILSLQDSDLRAWCPRALLDFFARRCGSGKPLRGSPARLLARLAQRTRERERRRRREALLKSDPDIG